MGNVAHHVEAGDPLLLEQVGRVAVGLGVPVVAAGVQEIRMKAEVRRMNSDKIFCMEARFSWPGHPGAV